MPAIVILIVGLVLSTSPSPVRAAVDCEAARCVVQSAIDDECPCGAANTHGAHVNCVAAAVGRLGEGAGLPRECRGHVKHCAAHSVCGKREGLVVCDLPVRCRLGTCRRCKIAPSAEHCLARHGTVSARSSCCAECEPMAPMPCGPMLTCDRATEVCVAREPLGPAIVYECKPVPVGCESDRSCACTGSSLCVPPFDVCNDVGANAIDCSCPLCQ
jgi:hypothetical protein